jgi:hypothetical protein
MAKAHSPLRLEENLVKKATLVSKQMHRSVAQQIEYWADLGERLSKVVTPEMLMQLSSGLARIHVEAVRGEPVDPEAVFMAVDQARDSGELANQVTTSKVKYRASANHPGMLERIDEFGNSQAGHFKNGEFVPADDEVSA